MEKFEVYHTERFNKELCKFNKKFLERVNKIENRLVENPFYGSPLGTRSFRETRFENYRIYYLVYEDLKAIYMVAISDKKDQQKVINTIRLFLDFFRQEIEKIVVKDKFRIT
jgi:mRNA-degrading endonuclease RelE of RelBE toxin-antitoxin system